MKRAPWHSTRPDDGVYHDNSACRDGQFPLLYRAEGTAGRPLCRECLRLDAEQRAAETAGVGGQRVTD